MTLVARSTLSLALGALGGLACDDGGERPEFAELADGNTAGAASTDWELVTLPFAVDNHFHDTGFMGAGQDGQVVPRPNDCGARSLSAQGACGCYEYAGASSQHDWAGLYWLSAYDNWGEQSGVKIESGAKRLRLRASSNPPGAPVEFVVGGISGGAHEDAFELKRSFELTESMREYEIDLSEADYGGGVIGGFAWILQTPEPTTICVDDIRWE